MCAKCNEIIETEDQETEKDPITCSDCSCVIKDGDETYQNPNDELICESCRDDYNYCEDCSSMVASDCTVWIEREEKCICDYCSDNNYFTCECCSRITNNNDQTTTSNGSEICQDCYDDNYFTCEDCGEVLHNHYYSDDCRCQDCDCSNEDDYEGLYNYSYKPTPIFQSQIVEKRSKTIKGVNIENYNTNKKLNYLGIELEHSVGRDSKADIIEQVYNLINNVYYKEDGSLDDGIELVTHPMEFYSINWKNWAEVLKYLRSRSCKSYDTSYSCGLHVHVNKEAFGNYGLLKAQYISAKVESFLHKISKRTRSNWRNWSAPSNISYPDMKAFKHEVIKRRLNKDKSVYNAPRGAFHGTSNTIELRMFRGTLNMDGFRSCVEFAKDISYILSQVSLTFLISKSEAEIEAYIVSSLRPKTRELLIKTNRITAQLEAFRDKTEAINDQAIQPDIESATF